ncbi:MAG: hypothetical protein H6744_15530 [Deltaproteobacteria bacterium]|nr:hypothetical protein [Deltaproteobacteria bacterium]MCB9788093.1 hypothetical protein [Deltaproteobacteria bacterium]
MSGWLRAWVAASLVALVGGPGLAKGPRVVTVGVFLPNAAFASNSERSLFAERAAAAIGREAGEDFTVVARAFARRSDLVKFLRARKLDLLIADPLFQVGNPGEVLAHAVDANGQIGPAMTLYASAGTKGLAALKGKPVAVTSASGQDLRFFAATLLRGEVDPRRYFGAVREAKDASAAVGAVHTGAAAAAFAPAGLAAASGLQAVLSGAVLPLAVLVGDLRGPAGALPPELNAAAVRALTLGGGVGGGIAGWRPGGGGALEAAGQDRIAVSAERIILAPAGDDEVAPPRVRLEATTTIPPVNVVGASLAPTLPEATP